MAGLCLIDYQTREVKDRAGRSIDSMAFTGRGISKNAIKTFKQLSTKTLATRPVIGWRELFPSFNKINLTADTMGCYLANIFNPDNTWPMQVPAPRYLKDDAVEDENDWVSFVQIFMYQMIQRAKAKLGPSVGWCTISWE